MQQSFTLFESETLIGLVWSGCTVCSRVVCWWSHLRPLQTAANAKCSETGDERLWDILMSTCVAVSWNLLYLHCFPFTGRVCPGVRASGPPASPWCLFDWIWRLTYLETWSKLSMHFCCLPFMCLIWRSRFLKPHSAVKMNKGTLKVEIMNIVQHFSSSARLLFLVN